VLLKRNGQISLCFELVIIFAVRPVVYSHFQLARP